MYTPVFSETTETFVELRGKVCAATLTITASHDDEPLEGSFDFGDSTENEAYLKRFECGELLNLAIDVKVSFNGLTGTDALGACHVKADAIENDVKTIVLEHGMIKQAEAELHEAILNLLAKVGA